MLDLPTATIARGAPNAHGGPEDVTLSIKRDSRGATLDCKLSGFNGVQYDTTQGLPPHRTV